MLDPKIFRSDLDQLVAALDKRGYQLNAAAYRDLEERRKSLQTEAEALRNERNVKSKNIGQAIKQGGNVEALKKEVGDVGVRLTKVDEQLAVVANDLEQLQLDVPNLPHSSVPPGESEEHNLEIRSWGNKPDIESPIDHVEIGERMEQMDFDAAAKISGARFVVLKGQLARLHRALTQFMLDTHINEHGYQEVYVPYLVLPSSLQGTGQLPKFSEDLFATNSDQGLHLIPTAEVPVTNLVREQIWDAEVLPLKFVCHTPCFRSEAGSHGKDTRGLIRQHQFEKVEMVQVVRPEDSYEALESLTANAEAILQKLELPYRVVALCGGDLGFSAAKTYDLEVWLPSQNCYREISSCSNFESFQARRMKARYRIEAKSKPALLHTLNGSGLAVGRTLVAILENGFDGNDTVNLPSALLPYMNGVKSLSLA